MFNDLITGTLRVLMIERLFGMLTLAGKSKNTI